MDAPVFHTYDLARPWRRATLVASTLAVVELVIVVALGVLVLARPVSHALAGSSTASRALGAVTHLKSAGTPAHRVVIRDHAVAAAVHTLPASRVRVLVLNGNGVSGAAGRAATAIHLHGYPIVGVANAAHENYPRTLILYRPGYRPEGMRLARQLGVRVVGPLDGVSVRSLHGGDLAVILGA